MAGRFDSSLVSRIQRASDIVEIVSEHLSLVKKGKELVGLCPFHTDHRPSMYVSPEKQIFKCFACGAGGDVIKFIEMREGLNFAQAVERLAERAGITIERRDFVRAGNAETESDPKAIAKANAWALKHWQGNLWNEQKGDAARKYLAQRQISTEMAKKWGLGLASDSWDELVGAARAAKANMRVLESAGLAVRREGGELYDKFRNRLMFPIWDVTGRVIAFGGRTLGNDPAKYMNSPSTVLFDKSNNLYGLNFARHSIASSGSCVVVEGYTDCMMSHQFGCENVVATLGTSLTAGHARLLRRYARKIVLVFDSDVAGMAAASRALEIFLAEGVDIRLASVPEGKDPCDFVLLKGKEAFESVISKAVDVMEYKWQRLVENLKGADTVAQQKAAAEEFLKAMALGLSAGKVDNITRGIIVSRLSGLMGLGQDVINDEIRRLTGRLGSTGSYAAANQKVVSIELPKGFFAKAQQQLLEVLLNRPGLCEKARLRITVDMFDVPILRHIAQILFELAMENPETGVAEVLSNIEDRNTAATAVMLADEGEKKASFDKDGFERQFEDALKAFEERKSELERKRSEDDEALRQYASKLAKNNLRRAGI